MLILEQSCHSFTYCLWLLSHYNSTAEQPQHRSSDQIRSVAQSCPTLCNPKNHSTPGFPVLHYLPEFAQTHIHWVGDAIQTSHPLPFPSPPALNLSLNQWLLTSSGQVLELQLQHQSFQWIFRIDFLEDGLVWSLCSPRDSQESSATAAQKHPFSSLSLLYGPTLISLHECWENNSLD